MMNSQESTKSFINYNQGNISSKLYNKNLPEYFMKLKQRKKKEIFVLIEEPAETQLNKVTRNVNLKKTKKNMSLKLYKERNTIKKVKTHCLKIFSNILKECLNIEETCINRNRLKNFEKNNIFKIFKTDISKFRNKLLLNMTMREILITFSNFNLNEDNEIKNGKKILFEFLMNSTWMDILLYIKRGNQNFVIINNKRLKPNEVSAKDINEYIEYIKNGSNNYKDRINLDKNYLILYDSIIKEYCLIKNDPSSENEFITYINNISDFITNYEEDFLE